MKIAVLLHLFYPDMWDNIRVKLNQLTQPYNLYVNLTENFYDEQTINNLKNFKSDVKIIVSENKGVAILGFLRLLKIVESNTDLILTIHTKKSLGLPEKPSDMVKAYGYDSAINRGKEWFEKAINGVLPDTNTINSIISLFNTDQTCGMVGYDNKETFVGANRPLLTELIKDFNLNLAVLDTPFVDGAMFWTRYSLFRKYFTDEKINLVETLTPAGYLNEPSINHSLERIFSYIITNENKKIHSTSFVANLQKLNELDIIIPLYIDHDDRLVNLTYVVETLKNYGCSNIYINEHYNDVPKANFITNVKYTSNKINEDSFNKMRCINEVAKNSKNKFIAVYDVDVILSKKAILQSLNMLNNAFDFVYPYDGRFFEIPKAKIKEFMTTFIININDCILCHPNSCGGCVIFKREVFEAGGMCNPNFKNVGFDDDEIKARFLKFGYKMGRTENCIFHLEHARTKTSYGISIYDKHNQNEYFRICNSDNKTLLEEIKKW